MDCTFTYQATEEGTTKALKRAYDAMTNYWHVQASVIAFAVLMAIAFCGLGVNSYGDAFLIGVVVALPPSYWLVRFRYVRAIVKYLRKNKAFDCPTEVHLTDEFMEVSRDGNVSRSKWKDGITHYLVVANAVLFFSNKLFAGGLQIQDGAFSLDELLPVLDKNGIRPYKRGGFRKYLVMSQCW